MPKTSEMRTSKFLTKDDVGRGTLATVKAVLKRNVAQEGADPEHKWCMAFHELDKPMVLNVTNIGLCEEIFGSDDTADWLDKPLVLYNDPNVAYAGKKVGGIRVRKPKAGFVPPPPPVATDAMVDADDIPF